MKKIKNNKKTFIIVSIILMIIVLVSTASYALFILNITEDKDFVVKIGSLEVTINDNQTGDVINLDKLIPISDSDAQEKSGYTFSITNTGKINSYYIVYLDEVEPTLGEKVNSNTIKFNLQKNGGSQSNSKIFGSFSNSTRVLDEGYLASGENNSYTLRLWLDYDATNEEQGKYFSTKIRVVARQANEIVYKETLLNGADPVISGDLLPVTIDANGVVKKANTAQEWYNYENKNWANAVILFDGAASKYKTGDVIDQDDIKQYYVWIPRYKYQLWNVGSGTLASDTNYPNGTEHESAINIVFESTKTTPSTGTNNGEWLTHPAFTNFGTNGIWVGKFETSYNENSFTNSSVFATSNTNTSVVTSASNIIIKPNVRSLTNKEVSTFYTLGRGVNTSLNSHMMTNMEWGAVAYLTYSLYGKCTSTGCEEVYINNVNTGYYPNVSANYSGQLDEGASITGCSASNSTAFVVGTQSSCATNYAWNEVNNKASTTGNITGIYDMSGGSNEYVMSVIKDASDNPISGQDNLYNSGFNGTYGCPICNSQSVLEKTTGINFPADNKYYNLYTANNTVLNDKTSWYQYTNGYLGDATKEIANTKESGYGGDRGLWFRDYAAFPVISNPWFIRGGYYMSGDGGGEFNFRHDTGSSKGCNSFRVTLAY